MKRAARALRLSRMLRPASRGCARVLQGNDDFRLGRTKSNEWRGRDGDEARGGETGKGSNDQTDVVISEVQGRISQSELERSTSVSQL